LPGSRGTVVRESGSRQALRRRLRVADPIVPECRCRGKPAIKAFIGLILGPTCALPCPKVFSIFQTLGRRRGLITRSGALVLSGTRILIIVGLHVAPKVQWPLCPGHVPLTSSAQIPRHILSSNLPMPYAGVHALEGSARSLRDLNNRDNLFFRQEIALALECPIKDTKVSRFERGCGLPFCNQRGTRNTMRTSHHLARFSGCRVVGKSTDMRP